MVFALPEPRNAKSAGQRAGARCGAQGTFALGGNEPQARRADEGNPPTLMYYGPVMPREGGASSNRRRERLLDRPPSRTMTKEGLCFHNTNGT